MPESAPKAPVDIMSWRTLIAVALMLLGLNNSARAANESRPEVGYLFSLFLAPVLITSLFVLQGPFVVLLITL